MAELPDIPTELSYDGRMINTKIVHTLRQVIKPVDTALNGSTVSFNIPNNVGESYLNLKETKILLTCSIQKADGTKMKSTDKRVLPSNNFLASLFDNVQVMINGTIVSTQDMCYHMKAYTNMAHSWTSSFAETEFENTGFLFEDGMQSFAGAVPKRKFRLNLDKSIRQVHTEENSAHKLQSLFVDAAGNGKEHTFLAKIHEMPFNTEQYLPGNMKVNVQFFRSKKETSVKGADSADFSVNIKSFELVVVFAQLKKNVYNVLETKLASDKLEIPVIRTIVAIHNLNAKQTPQTNNDVFVGQKAVVPERVYFTIVDLNYNSPSKDDYNYEFKHEGLESYTLQLPNGSFQPDQNFPPFDLELKKADNIPYSDFTETFGLKDGLNVLVTQTLYNKVHSFFSQQIAPREVSDDIVQPTALGHLGLRLEFKANKPSGQKLLLVWAEFKETITIDKNRRVTTTWSS